MSLQLFNPITDKIVLPLCSLFRALNGDVCELGNFDSSLIRFSLIHLFFYLFIVPIARKTATIVKL